MPRSAAQRSRTSSGADTSRVGWTTSAMRVGGDLATTSQTLVPSASGRLRRARWGTVRMMDADRARELLARERSRAERTLARLGPDRSDELSDYDQHPA